jgi:signal transduction histidine kinase
MRSISPETQRQEKISFLDSHLFPLQDRGKVLELPQATLRLLVGTLAMLYLVYTVFYDRIISKNDNYTLITAGTYIFLAFSLLLWVRKCPSPMPFRRIFGILLDNGAITAALYFHDELGVPLFILYLWVSFGNGFRYGLNYLAFSATCSVLGFLFISVSSLYFHERPYISHTLLLGLIILPIYIAALLRQLTKTIESAESANRAKSNFLATMSHEIRTPLNGLVGITDLLEKTELNDKQKHYVNLISKSSDWLMRVITDGLDFSKIEANELLLMEEPFKLKETLEELCSLYKGVHKKNQIAFNCQIPDNLPSNVIGDQLRLTQILGNLITNAFKFTDSGSVSLKVELLEKKKIGNVVQFMVEDTGPGIPSEELVNIFKPFKQVTRPENKEVGGTGLGLTIAHRLISLMGSKLEVTSSLGEGSSFFFSLFFSTAKVKGNTEQENAKKPTVPFWKTKPNILLAEDHEINIEVIGSQLTKMGCNVHFAKNGQEAVEQFKSSVFDLLLMDCQMPILDGYEATKAIRLHEKEKPGEHHTPIIALTAYVTIDDKKKCLECGMDDYLGKPFRVADLQNKLFQWLHFFLELDKTAAPQAPPENKIEVKAANSQNNRPDKERKVLHDLRNSLFIIQANAEFSMSPDIDLKEKEKFAKIIHEAVHRAVNNLEALSQTHEKKLPL